MPKPYSYDRAKSGEAGVEVGCELLAVKVLTYEHEFDHAVAIGGIPVAGKVGVGAHHLHELIFRSSSEPVACLGEFFLHSRLLKEVAHIHVVPEIEHTLGSDDIFWPLTAYEIIEFVDVKRAAAIINKSLDAILLGFALAMMVVVMVAMLVMAVSGIMVRLLIMVVMVVVVMVISCLGFLLGCGGFLNFAHPRGGGCHALKVEQVGAENIGEGHIAVVGVNDFGGRLNGAYNGTYS